MRNVFRNLILAGLCCLELLGAEDRLNLFIWSEYIDPEVIAEFEGQHHCRVVIDLYEDEAAMMSKLRNSGVGLYDVVVPPDHSVAGLVALDLIAPLRPERIPNKKNLGKRFVNPPYDPGNRYTVAYQWGTVGLYLRTSLFPKGADSWGVIFDPALQPKTFVLIDSPRDLIGVALRYKGHSLNSVEVAALKTSRDLILAAKARSIGFDGSVGAKNKVLSRTAHAAIVYSGEAARGMLEDSDTSYVIPKEGSQIWQDNLAIVNQAPHRELAEAFINFVLEPRIGARISNYTQCGSPNEAARPFLNERDLKNPVIYPPEEVMERLEFLKDRGAQRRLYDEIWTQIKSH